jgi:glycosyltransferase involved in cell wall biosynthesis
MTEVLVVSSDIVDRNMAGMGVRYWEIAHALADNFSVTLALPGSTSLASDKVRLFPYDLEGGDLRPVAAPADVIVVQGFVLHFHPYLKELGLPIVVDLYVPYLLESLIWHMGDDKGQWIPAYEEYLRVQLELLRVGDFFICASERQRDYWLGWLHAQKRINPHTIEGDPGLRKLIDVVPFGIPSTDPPVQGDALRGSPPKFSVDDRIILWAGGIWDWLDPLTPIAAMGLLRESHPEVKLYFMGMGHPNPVVDGMTMGQRAIEYAQEIGLYGETVFFGEWVPYAERVKYLMDANASVIAHQPHLETRFSFRTRVLDCIWTGLPIVITEGDVMAEWVREYGLGFVVKPGDPQAMAGAFEKAVIENSRSSFQPAFAKIRASLHWKETIRPLVAFCRDPKIAPDKGLYLTETERISQDKDRFLQQVIQDKDAFLQQVIRDKDAFLEKVIKDKDAAFAQMLRQRDDLHERKIQQLEEAHRKTIRDLQEEIDRLSNELQIAERWLKQLPGSLPLRLYLKIKRFFGAR